MTALTRLPVPNQIPLPSNKIRRLIPLRPKARAAVDARLRTLVETLSGATSLHEHSDTSTLLAALEQALAEPTLDRVWLTCTVLGAHFPDPATVRRVARTMQLDGPGAGIDQHILAPLFTHVGRSARASTWPEVVVVTDRVIVDIDNTSKSSFMTGIQRVAHETTLRWARDHDPVIVSWHPHRAAIRTLPVPEPGSDGRHYGHGEPIADSAAVLVPWRCTYLLPELVADPQRVTPLNALMRYSGNTTGVIGFDCVPMTSAETIASDAVGNGFAGNLAAVAHITRIGTISEAAATEYRGWRTMLAGAGLSGPEIEAISLPAECVTPTAEALDFVRRQLTLGGLPMVLAVGSHEPRKNHEAVLHAAELLWREGLNFTLLFIGGNAWNSGRFERRLTLLSQIGRPIQMLSAVSDDQLWAAYQLAHCTIFPSLNEGFGLPVAESLASGTPVITSNFGSMREIAEGGGALLVDPRDDHSIAAALRSILQDDSLHSELQSAARARSPRTWDDYARELWAYLVPAEPESVQ